MACLSINLSPRLGLRIPGNHSTQCRFMVHQSIRSTHLVIVSVYAPPLASWRITELNENDGMREPAVSICLSVLSVTISIRAI